MTCRLAHERLASLFEQTGDYPAARAHAQKALDLNPRAAMAQTALAKILLSEGREEEEREDEEGDAAHGQFTVSV